MQKKNFDYYSFFCNLLKCSTGPPDSEPWMMDPGTGPPDSEPWMMDPGTGPPDSEPW